MFWWQEKKTQTPKTVTKFAAERDELIAVISAPFVKAPHGREHLIIAKSARLEEAAVMIDSRVHWRLWGGDVFSRGTAAPPLGQ